MDENDPMTWYLREISPSQPLTEEEEADLLRHVRSQDERAEFASSRLIEAKLALVVSIVERYSSADTNMLDLVSKGNEGLILAVTTFRENSGRSFTTHAVECIEEAITKR